MIKIIQEKKPKYFFHIINFSPLKQLRYELNFVNRENSYYMERERLEMQARRALIQQRLSQIPLLNTMILFWFYYALQKWWNCLVKHFKIFAIFFGIRKPITRIFKFFNYYKYKLFQIEKQKKLPGFFYSKKMINWLDSIKKTISQIIYR